MLSFHVVHQIIFLIQNVPTCGMGKRGALVFTFSLIAFCCPIGWPRHVSLVSDLKESQGKSMQQKEQANLNL